MKRLLLAGTLLLLMGAGPCSESKQTTPVAGSFEGEGIVHQGVGPECPNVWHISTTDGRRLWPVEDAAFQVEGLRVRFSARERTDMASICMAGTIVDLIAIRKL